MVFLVGSGRGGKKKQKIKKSPYGKNDQNYPTKLPPKTPFYPLLFRGCYKIDNVK